tara:strand:- start:273 stop:1187 length:915 start_codon:yes stop_codon:yes gene_type:complete
MDISALITQGRTIKQSSLKSYLIILKKLNDDEPILNLEFLKDTDNILQKIETKALTTQKNYLSAVLVTLNSFNKAEFNDAVKIYGDESDRLNDEYMAFIQTHEKDEKQKKNWTTIANLKKAMNRTKRNIDERGILKKEELNKTEMQLLQEYVIAGLFILQPPVRLNFNMLVVNKREDIEEGKNYLLVESRNKKKFIIADYKTAKTYDTKEMEVNPEINKILNYWLKYNKTGFFLLNTRGGMLSSNGLSKMITQVFASTNKHITLNLIRHVYISENIDIETVNKSTQLASDMHHALLTQHTYIKV